MLVTYGRFGVYANIAVVINVFVILGVLALLNGTLTLPGIAGFVLTIGTAVDANVLINERIREERRRGRSVVKAVELGYKEASRTIFEANATHAISRRHHAAARLRPGEGLRGRAADRHRHLGVHRRHLHPHADRRLYPPPPPRSAPHLIGGTETMRLLKLVPDNTNIGFVRLRYWAFGLTAPADRAGGRAGVRARAQPRRRFRRRPDDRGEVRHAAASSTGLRSTVDRLGVGEAPLQQSAIQKLSRSACRRPRASDRGATNAVVKRVQDALTRPIPRRRTSPSTDTRRGKVSGELVRSGILAVRARGVRHRPVRAGSASNGSSACRPSSRSCHDVLMTLGFFALTRLEFDLNIVAAVLTIIGYSINDKIVIDDRIRENMRKYRKMDMREIIDLSVNETLPRTVMTSLTILLALGALLLFGGHVLRGFTAAMILGVIVGTYSSIYVSSSLLITLGLKPQPLAAPKVKGLASGAERITKRRLLNGPRGPARPRSGGRPARSSPASPAADSWSTARSTTACS